VSGVPQRPPDPRERFAPCPAHLDARSLFVAFLSLLIGYWAVMNFVPVPEIGAASFEQGANLANWIDEQYLPGLKLREHDRHASNEQEQRKHGRCRGSAPTGAC
jgi:hypothetical protein